jgi:beta-1,4-mannosyl-glycoprotein beta-1,4-N-acetylglucosaminyltransferase
MKVFDVFMFGYELDLLEIRLNILDPYVDYFVFSEAGLTFSGEKKPFYFDESDKRFDKFRDKIIYNRVPDPTPEQLQAKGVEYRVKRETYMRDAYQKDTIMEVLKEHCSDDDVIIWSDLDEIPNPDVLEQLKDFYKPGNVYNFAQDNYQASLNYFENSQTIHSQTLDFSCGNEGRRWIGTKMCDFATIKKYALSEFRREIPKEFNHRIYPGGWHWSTVGSNEVSSMQERVMKKMKSSAHFEYNDERLVQEYQERIREGRDPLGRENASYNVIDIDNSNFPDYILQNKEKYSYLIMQ